MITQEQWSLIHALRKQEGWGIRHIARQMNLARNTVRNGLERDSVEAATPRASRETVLTPFKSQLAELALQAGYNAKGVYAALLGQGYAGGYQQVARMVRPLREKARTNVMLASRACPGQEGHVYWGTTLVWMGETRVRVQIFLIVLGYSGLFTGTFVLDETMATFLNCHAAAFHYFKGVPKHIVYDNPKKVVVQFEANGQPLEWHPQLMEYLEGLGVEPLTGTFGSIQTKGRMVAILKTVKENFLCGRRFENMKSLNAKFEQWLNHMMTGPIRGVEPLGQIERFRQEQQHLLTWDEKKLA